MRLVMMKAFNINDVKEFEARLESVRNRKNYFYLLEKIELSSAPESSSNTLHSSDGMLRSATHEETVQTRVEKISLMISNQITA